MPSISTQKRWANLTRPAFDAIATFVTMYGSSNSAIALSDLLYASIITCIVVLIQTII